MQADTSILSTKNNTQKIVDDSSFVIRALVNTKGSGTVTSVATGNGLSGGTVTASGTLQADTSILSTKNNTQKIVNDSSSVIRALVNTKGSGTVTSVATGYGLSGGTITSTGTLNVDTATMATRLRTRKEIDSVSVVVSTGLAGKSNTGHGHAQSDITGLVTDLSNKQATLVSATNIKTINGSSVLGAGDLVVSASAGGSTTQMQFNNAGALAGASFAKIEGNNIRIENSSTPSVSAGGFQFYAKNYAGTPTPFYRGGNGNENALQSSFAQKVIAMWQPAGNSTTITAFGAAALTATGTATAANVAVTNAYTRSKGLEYLVTVAATTAVAGFRTGTAQYWFGNATGQGGFKYTCRFSPATGVATTTSRLFVGMSASTGAPTDVEPSSLVNIFGVGYDAADANIQFLYNDASGTATKVDLGGSFVVPTTDRNTTYELSLYVQPNTSVVFYTLTDLGTTVSTTGSVNTNLPTTTTLLSALGYMSVGGTSSVIGIALKTLYIETDF